MAGLASKDQIGVRQDLSELIVEVDMRNTPVFTMLPKGSELVNMLTSWQFETLLTPTLQGVLSDKDRTQFENHANRGMLYAHCKISERAPMVGRVAQNVNNVAGMGKKAEMTRSIKNALTVFKRDIEVSICSGLEGNAESGETPAQIRGMFVAAQPTLQTDVQTAHPIAARTPTDAIYTGAWADLTEDIVRDTMMRAIWEETGGMVDGFQLVVGSDLKTLVTSWMIYDSEHVSSTSAPLRRFDNSTNEDSVTLHASVGCISGDYGDVELTPTPWLRWDIQDGTSANLTLRRRSGIGFDPENHRMRFNQAPAYRAFQDNGGGPRGLIDGIYTREDLNPRRMMVIAPAS